MFVYILLTKENYILGRAVITVCILIDCNIKRKQENSFPHWKLPEIIYEKDKRKNYVILIYQIK